MTYSVIYYFYDTDPFIDTYTDADAPYIIKARPGYDYTQYSLTGDYEGSIYHSGDFLPIGDYSLYEYPGGSSNFPEIDDNLEFLIQVNFSGNGTTIGVPLNPEPFIHMNDLNPFVYDIPNTTPQREGYAFQGWECSYDNRLYCDPFNGDPDENFTADISEATIITFTAQWVILSKATITFTSSLSISNEIEYWPSNLEYNELVSFLPQHLYLPKRKPRSLNSGFLFDGWHVKQGPEYMLDLELNPDTAVEIYGSEDGETIEIIIEALWKPIGTPIIYYDFFEYEPQVSGDNETVFMKTLECFNVNDKILINKHIQPSIKNYEFLFWGIDGSHRIENRITLLTYSNDILEDTVIKVFGIWGGPGGMIDMYFLNLYDSTNILNSTHYLEFKESNYDANMWTYNYLFLPDNINGKKIKYWQQKTTNKRIAPNTLFTIFTLKLDDEINTIFNLYAVMQDNLYIKTEQGWKTCSIQQKTSEGWKNVQMKTKTEKGWQ